MDQQLNEYSRMLGKDEQASSNVAVDVCVAGQLFTAVVLEAVSDNE
ncbi:hypothetical protein ACFOQM_10120 [Paenibacillus sp. GCM10012307]